MLFDFISAIAIWNAQKSPKTSYFLEIL